VTRLLCLLAGRFIDVVKLVVADRLIR